MELKVFPRISLDILIAERFVKSLDIPLQLRQIFFVYFLSGKISSQTFQVLTDEKELKDIFLGKLNDKGALLRKDFNQSLFF